MPKIQILIVLLLLCSTSILGMANTERENEIQHLLKFIASSGCTFIRNHSEYSANKAKSHLETKYNYVKSRIASTEDFIKYAATKSSMSGKHYMVLCNGNRNTSSKWLINELANYRKQQSVQQ